MTLNDEDMEVVQSYKYLGVTACHNLSWSAHIQTFCEKARKVLRAIVLKHCKTHIRSDGCSKTVLVPGKPLLEYESQVWSPYTSRLRAILRAKPSLA